MKIYKSSATEYKVLADCEDCELKFFCIMDSTMNKNQCDDEYSYFNSTSTAELLRLFRFIEERYNLATKFPPVVHRFLSQKRIEFAWETGLISDERYKTLLNKLQTIGITQY